MQVLVTRPSDEAARTAAALELGGHTAILSPVLEMVPTGAQWPQGVVGAVLATSAQAFDLFSESPDWPLPEARRLLPLFAVGARTVEAGRQRGFEGPELVAADAKELTEKIGERPGGPLRIVYLAGRDRKSGLETRLTEAGHKVDIVEVYSAQAAESLADEAISLISNGAVRAALHYSRRSAQIFLTLAGRAGLDVSRLTHVAISPDAAAPLWDADFKNAHAAEQPNEESMLKLLYRLTDLSERHGLD